MTAVIDASALVAYCLNEGGLDRERLREHLRKGVISIGLIRAESANAIVVANRRKVIGDGEAEGAFMAMLDLSTNNVKMMPENDDLISSAFEMGRNSTLAIYDLLYLSLAKKTGSVFISKDETQVREAERLGILIEKI